MKQVKQLVEEERKLNAHSFNITDRESMFFYSEKVLVEHAELFIDDVLMAFIVCKQTKAEPQTELRFFGELPLHRALLKCPVRVVIHTYDDDIPSLSMQMVETLTWEAIDASELIVNVSVATKNGPVEKRMMYRTLYAGYLPDTPSSISSETPSGISTETPVSVHATEQPVDDLPMSFTVAI